MKNEVKYKMILMSECLGLAKPLKQKIQQKKVQEHNHSHIHHKHSHAHNSCKKSKTKSSIGKLSLLSKVKPVVKNTDDENKLKLMSSESL